MKEIICMHSLHFSFVLQFFFLVPYVLGSGVCPEDSVPTVRCCWFM